MERYIVKETETSLAKGIIGAIPYVGTVLNEALFDCRARIHQQRLNHFIEELIKYLSTIDETKFNQNNIKSEEFIDIFESILKRVITNKSTEKLHRFKRILVKEMIAPSLSDYTETFLDIVSKINEKQIEILIAYQCIQTNQDEIKKLTATQFILDERTYRFYIQDLASKCLLLDDSINRIGTRPLTIMAITEFGKAFLDFIEGAAIVDKI